MAWLALLLLPLLLAVNEARIHKLSLNNETRFVVHLSTFGYFANGTLEVNLTSLSLPQVNKTNFSSNPVGFSLSRSRVNGVLAYTAEDTEKCTLLKPKSDDVLVLFIIDPLTLSVQVKSFAEVDIVLTAEEKKGTKETRTKRDATVHTADKTTTPDKVTSGTKTDKTPEQGQDPKTQVQKGGGANQEVGGADQKGGGTGQKDEKGLKEDEAEKKEVDKQSVVTTAVSKKGKDINGMKLTLAKFKDFYNFTFRITMGAEDQGLYNLNFHNCYNMKQGAFSPYSLKTYTSSTYILP
ncbi:hypothetical protein NFI96_027689 [Prochilodus magdalenae]|nr:hypothetical protein NFI96_027689 [Prochilodus magdalenae]